MKKRIWIPILAAVAILLGLMLPASASPTSDWVIMYPKDPSTWMPISPNETAAVLHYEAATQRGERYYCGRYGYPPRPRYCYTTVEGTRFHLEVRELDESPYGDDGSDFKLIYYTDPWPGDKGFLLREFTVDFSGRYEATWFMENITIPVPADDNYPAGGKVWIVPASHWGGEMTKWEPTKYLYESWLITID